MSPFFAISLFGCPGPGLPDPVVDRVTPAFAYNGDDETVTIVGHAFYPQLSIDSFQGEADVDPAFQAWLLGPRGGIELARELVGVGILDDTHLSATVEAGLPAGEYDLEVLSPAGGRGRLARGFTVTDVQAVRLVLGAETPLVPISEPAELSIMLADLGGDAVSVPIEVAITATLAGGIGALTFEAGTLQNAELLPDGVGLHGFLPKGVGTVELRSTVPDRVTVTVSPWESSSQVLSDTLDILYQPGGDLQVQLALPSAEPLPTFVAGEPLTITAQVVDQYGNPSPHPLPVPLVFTTLCSGALPVSADLDGPTQFEITPRDMTDASCPQDRVVSWGLDGSSPPFTVVAGPADHFFVLATPLSLSAGDQLTTLVDPRDLNDNHADWAGTLGVTDSLGGLLETQCFGSGAFVCTGTVSRAGVGLTVEARGDDGAVGISNTFDVQAGDVPGAIEASTVGPAVAGEPLAVDVVVADSWGNPMTASQLGLDSISVDDDLGEADCILTGFSAAGSRVEFDCVLYTARSGATLVASVPAEGVFSAPVVVDVENGALGVVWFSGEAPVEVGFPLVLGVVGTDAWGNPYLVQTDPVFELTDDTGTFSATSVTLGPDGSGAASGSFTGAGLTTVHAWQAGLELGQSAPILVTPGSPSALRVTPGAQWGWVGEPLSIVVEAVDSFGNRADQDGTVTVSSASTASTPVDVTLVDGVGVALFSWTSAAFVDTLLAAGSGLSGAVDVPVSARCTVGGPSVTVTFAGEAEAVACMDPYTGISSINGSLGGSLAGSSALVGYGLAAFGEALTTDSQPNLALELSGTGPHPLGALAVDAAGCGAEVEALAWTGPDDGTPTGPLLVVPADPNVAVFDTTTIEVLGVVDCSRDPASFQEIEIRTTGGALLGPVATGEGLRMTLDMNGDGAATLTTDGALSAGTIEVHATTESGAASGVGFLPLVGDNNRPIVVAQDPTGYGDQPVSTVSLTFSEPLLASGVVPANFAVTGPAAVTVVGATQVGSEVTLTLSPTANGAAGIWTVLATSALRDVAGNKLAGTWGLVGADYLGTFGSTPGSPPVLTCTSFDPAELVLRPDGDPGPGPEADQVSIGVSSASAPAWWVLEVRDAGDARVWQDRFVPLGAVDTLVWPGRDFRGLVVPNGTWQVAVWPEDGQGNPGLGCEGSVTLDNAPGWPQ